MTARNLIELLKALPPNASIVVRMNGTDKPAEYAYDDGCGCIAVGDLPKIYTTYTAAGG